MILVKRSVFVWCICLMMSWAWWLQQIQHYDLSLIEYSRVWMFWISHMWRMLKLTWPRVQVRCAYEQIWSIWCTLLLSNTKNRRCWVWNQQNSFITHVDSDNYFACFEKSFTEQWINTQCSEKKWILPRKVGPFIRKVSCVEQIHCVSSKF